MSEFRDMFEIVDPDLSKRKKEDAYKRREYPKGVAKNVVSAIVQSDTMCRLAAEAASKKNTTIEREIALAAKAIAVELALLMYPEANNAD